MANEVNTDFLDAVVAGNASTYQEPVQANPEPSASEPTEETPTPSGAASEEITPSGDEQTPTEPTTDNNPVTPQASTDTVDYDAYIAKISNGAFGTSDQLTEFLAKRDHYQGLESQLAETQSKIQALEQAKPVFANERVQKLNELYASGATEEQIEAFHFLNKAGELSDLPQLEVRKMALMLKHGLTGSEADTYLQSQYTLDEEEHDALTVSQSKVKLKLDANDDLKYLQDYKAKVSEAPSPSTTPQEAQPDQAAIEAQRTAYLQEAKPVIADVVKGYDQIKGISLNGRQGDDALTTDLPVSDETKATLEKALTDFAVNNQIALDEKGKQAIQSYAENLVVLHNWKNWAVDINSKAEKRMAERYHNPSKIQRPEDRESTVQDDHQQALDWVLNHS